MRHFTGVDSPGGTMGSVIVSTGRCWGVVPIGTKRRAPFVAIPAGSTTVAPPSPRPAHHAKAHTKTNVNASHRHPLAQVPTRSTDPHGTVTETNASAS